MLLSGGFARDAGLALQFALSTVSNWLIYVRMDYDLSSVQTNASSAASVSRFARELQYLISSLMAIRFLS
jgi:hypothetical protein